MKTYELISEDSDEYGLVLFAANLWHKDIVSARTKLDLLFFSDDSGEKMKVGGYPAFAKIRICTMDERAAGRGDAEIVIDKPSWATLCEKEKIAVIDHELEHLQLCLDRNTANPKKDDLGRPKFRLKRHDFQVGWFESIASRHGKNSQECQQAKFAERKFVPYLQLEFDFEKNPLPEAKPKQDEFQTSVTFDMNHVKKLREFANRALAAK